MGGEKTPKKHAEFRKIADNVFFTNYLDYLCT